MLCYAARYITSLAGLPNFNGIDVDFKANLGAWRSYFDSSDTHAEKLPGKWEAELDPMQKLCVLRSVRPDKVVPGMELYVKRSIGEKFVLPPPFDLATSFKDSNNVLPIVFVLSPGADPYGYLYKFADEMKFSKKLSNISLGQGQGPIAEKLINMACDRGQWVMLQNCHLCPSWMPRLEAIVEQYKPDEIHRDYRLWLTSMPSEKFPVSVLQNSVKMTLEPPRGVRLNLNGSYNDFTDSYLESQGAKAAPFKKLLYAACFFHAMLQDRSIA